MKKILKRIALTLVGIVGLAICAGVLYQFVGNLQDSRSFSQQPNCRLRFPWIRLIRSLLLQASRLKKPANVRFLASTPCTKCAVVQTI